MGFNFNDEDAAQLRAIREKLGLGETKVFAKGIVTLRETRDGEALVRREIELKTIPGFTLGANYAPDDPPEITIHKEKPANQILGEGFGTYISLFEREFKFELNLPTPTIDFVLDPAREPHEIFPGIR